MTKYAILPDNQKKRNEHKNLCCRWNLHGHNQIYTRSGEDDLSGQIGEKNGNFEFRQLHFMLN